MAGCLAQADVTWDDGLEDISWEISVDFVADLQRQARAPIEHCQDNPEYGQAGIQPLTDELDGLYKVSQPLERVELALQRHQHPIGGDQRINGQQPKRRRAIDDDVLSPVTFGGECIAKPVFPTLETDELNRLAAALGAQS